MMWVQVEGRPQGKSRPRFSNGRAYTPRTTVDYEKRVAMAYREQDGVYHTEPVAVEVLAVYKIPKAMPKGRKAEIMAEAIPPTVKPDIDNIIKVVMDALNGVAYKDDAAVAFVTGAKMYDPDGERLMVRVTEAGDWVAKRRIDEDEEVDR